MEEWDGIRRKSPLIGVARSVIAEPWDPNIKEREDNMQAELPRTERVRILNLILRSRLPK